MSGKTHELLTATVVTFKEQVFTNLNTARLKMKSLDEAAIQDYIETDNPIDCAGSYKIESVGSSLFQEIECSDWTAIEGLPLIWLSGVLDQLRD